MSFLGDFGSLLQSGKSEGSDLLSLSECFISSSLIFLDPGAFLLFKFSCTSSLFLAAFDDLFNEVAPLFVDSILFQENFASTVPFKEMVVVPLLGALTGDDDRHFRILPC